MSTKFYNLKQQISNTPEIDEAISEKGIKDYADKVGVPFAVPTCTAGSGSSPYLSVKWDLANIAGTTTPYDGMKICVRPDTTGVSTAGALLSIDGGTTYHPVVYGTNTVITSTYFTANTPIVLVYNSTQTANGYATEGTATTYTGVWQMDYKFTTYMYRLSHNYGTYITKTDLKRYKLLLQYDETTMLPISSGSSTSGHTIDTTNTFNPFGQICYCTSSTTNYKSAGAAIGASVLANMYAFDLRYTFNGGTTMLVANKDVYLVANPQSDGKAKIDSSPLTQTLPSTEDNKIYIYLGHTYSAYQMELHPVHPIYYYKDGAIREWTNAKVSDGGEITTVTMNGVLNDHEIAISNVSHTWTQISALLSQGKTVEVLLTMDGNEYRLRYVNYDNQFESVISVLDVSVWYDEGDEEWSGWLEYLTALNFDGSSTTNYLSQAGWFEPLPTYTDEHVKQIKAPVENRDFPILMTPKPVDQSFNERTDVTQLVPNIYINPYSETLSAPYFSGNGASLTNVPVGSHTHGNIQNGGTLQTNDIAIANGDKLVVTDSSDSNKVARTSVTFDGTTTNKYLSPKGTWESLPTIPETPVCQTAQTSAVNGDTYTASITGFTSTLTNFRFALVLKQAPGTQGNIKININSTGAQYVKYWNADGQSTSLLGGNSVQQGDVLDITYGASSGLTLIAIKRGGTNVITGSVTSVQVQATSPVQSSQSTAQTGTLSTTISLASAYGDTQNPYGSKTANTVLAAPNGSAGTPSFRSLVPSDLPDVTVTMNLTSGSNNTYTVSNASHTPTEVMTALTAGKSVVIVATIDSAIMQYFVPGSSVTSYILAFYSAMNIMDINLLMIGSDLTQSTPSWTANYVNLISTASFDTTDTATYLRHDGTWATPSGGGGGDTGYTYEALATNASTVSFGSSKGYKAVAVTGSTQTFNIAVSNTCTNYLLVENTGSGDCAVAIGVQSGTSFTSVVKPSAGITVGAGKAVELSFISINSGTRLVVTVSAEMEVDTLS